MLFNFKLRHVPAKDHVSADGLSRRPRSPEDPDEDDDVEEWIDQAYAFSMECLNAYVEDVRTKPSHKNDNGETFSIHMDRPSNAKQDSGLVLSTQIQHIPESEQAKEKESKLAEIRRFLEDPVRNTDMKDQEFQRFVRKASDFFVLDNKLWKKDRLGRHKLVLEKPKRLEVI